MVDLTVRLYENLNAEVSNVNYSQEDGWITGGVQKHHSILHVADCCRFCQICSDPLFLSRTEVREQ